MSYACAETELLAKLRQVNFAVMDQAESHLPQFRLRVDAIEVKTAEVKVHLDIPAWDKIIAILNSCSGNKILSTQYSNQNIETKKRLCSKIKKDNSRAITW